MIKLYIIATFRSPVANFIRLLVTWRWSRDQRTLMDCC